MRDNQWHCYGGAGCEVHTRLHDRKGWCAPGGGDAPSAHSLPSGNLQLLPRTGQMFPGAQCVRFIQATRLCLEGQEVPRRPRALVQGLRMCANLSKLNNNIPSRHRATKMNDWEGWNINIHNRMERHRVLLVECLITYGQNVLVPVASHKAMSMALWYLQYVAKVPNLLMQTLAYWPLRLHTFAMAPVLHSGDLCSTSLKTSSIFTPGPLRITLLTACSRRWGCPNKKLHFSELLHIFLLERPSKPSNCSASCWLMVNYKHVAKILLPRVRQGQMILMCLFRLSGWWVDNSESMANMQCFPII